MRMLDLCCGGGGAAKGYAKAGITNIVGVDIGPHPRYPYAFIQDDMRNWLDRLDEFDFVHASPPCQLFSQARRSDNHPDLLTPTLEALRDWDGVWVVENVVGARRAMRPTVMLCGSSFGLRVRRYRLFESNILIPPLECRHKEQGRPVSVYGHNMGRPRPNTGLSFRNKADASDAMGGLDWMTLSEIVEAIPWQYTEYIGRFVVRHLKETIKQHR